MGNQSVWVSTTTATTVIVLSAYATLASCQPAIVESDTDPKAALVGPPVAGTQSLSAAATWLMFQFLAQQWKSERGAASSITEMATLESYQKIVGMGEAALPFIIKQLRDEGDDPDQWFWALRAIAKTDPVKDEDLGDYAKMAQAWIEWAERENVELAC
jgi:hypothetical protein